MTIIPALPEDILNGTIADASQVMANFNAIVTAVNANAAGSGVNTNITSINGLTTPLSALQGGTGVAAPTANCVLVGEGNSAVNLVGPGLAGQALGSNGSGADPSFQGGFVPTGAAMWWPTSTAPTGWVEAAGQSTTGMSATIVAIYGATLPDMRGVFARGWDHGRGLDPNSPSLLSYIADEFKSHAHTITDLGHEHPLTVEVANLTAGVSAPEVVLTGGSPVNSTGSAVTNITIDNTGGSETAPKYMAWMFIIKT